MFKTINDLEEKFSVEKNESYVYIGRVPDEILEIKNSIEKEHIIGLFIPNTKVITDEYIHAIFKEDRHVFCELCFVNNQIREYKNLIRIVAPMTPEITDKKKHLFNVIKIY